MDFFFFLLTKASFLSFLNVFFLCVCVYVCGFLMSVKEKKELWECSCNIIPSNALNGLVKCYFHWSRQESCNFLKGRHVSRSVALSESVL